MERDELVRHLVERDELERHLMVRNVVVRYLLVEPVLEWDILVGHLMVGYQLVRDFLVRNILEWSQLEIAPDARGKRDTTQDKKRGLEGPVSVHEADEWSTPRVENDGLGVVQAPGS